MDAEDASIHVFVGTEFELKDNVRERAINNSDDPFALIAYLSGLYASESFAELLNEAKAIQPDLTIQDPSQDKTQQGAALRVISAVYDLALKEVQSASDEMDRVNWRASLDQIFLIIPDLKPG